MQSLSAAEARRIAIAAQGLAAPRPHKAAGRAQIRKIAERLGAVQIDSVNVLARSHYLPHFARLGPYAPALLEDEAWGKRPSLFEYWGHAASLMPVTLQPLFRWRMAMAHARLSWGSFQPGGEDRAYADTVLQEIARRGPVTGGDFAEGKRVPGWWSWSRGKTALEWLFLAGLVTTRTRRNFERVYDLTERVLPAAVVNAPTPSDAEAHRALLQIAARAMGVATEPDLRDYFRMPAVGSKARLAELVEDGTLEAVTVEGWKQPAFRDASVRLAREGAPGALMSPFDSMIWRRERAERLFGARLKLEIYTPAAERRHGYYVLPFLYRDAIAARVDLKADRHASRLRVQAAHLEPGAAPDATAAALAAELTLMCGWLGLDRIAVARRGKLAPALRAALRRA
jgi:uncharacterized protein YcaQ